MTWGHSRVAAEDIWSLGDEQELAAEIQRLESRLAAVISLQRHLLATVHAVADSLDVRVRARLDPPVARPPHPVTAPPAGAALTELLAAARTHDAAAPAAGPAPASPTPAPSRGLAVWDRVSAGAVSAEAAVQAWRRRRITR